MKKGYDYLGTYMLLRSIQEREDRELKDIFDMEFLGNPESFETLTGEPV